ncbi:DoxX family protein [Actinoplanes sp. NPDC051513]|uniref:DoxX family protein n=1 Tax=Actinoplanes sp. NPDC051513 TaxID=3363908 RepID=UPI00378B4121
MLTVVSLLLAVLLLVVAIRKLTHAPAVVESYRRVGVPERRLNLLALILATGGAGLVAGLWWRPLGVAAAAGLLVYFVLAVVAHVRHQDLKPLPTPVAFLALSAAVLALHLA